MESPSKSLTPFLLFVCIHLLTQKKTWGFFFNCRHAFSFFLFKEKHPDIGWTRSFLLKCDKKHALMALLPFERRCVVGGVVLMSPLCRCGRGDLFLSFPFFRFFVALPLTIFSFFFWPQSKADRKPPLRFLSSFKLSQFRCSLLLLARCRPPVRPPLLEQKMEQ